MNVPPEPPASSGPWGDPQQWSTPEPEDAEQPASIRLAVRLMWVGAALSVLRIFAVFLQTDEIREQVVENATERLSPSEVDAAVAGALTVAGLLGVVGTALWVWMATTNGQGKSWARTTATVLGAVNVVVTFVGVAVGQLPAIGLVIAIVTIVLAVSILVLLYKPESSRYYELMSP
jgi:hypothetical protein